MAGGLVAVGDAHPVFVADAVADPCSGLIGATIILEAVGRGQAGLIEVSLAQTAARLAQAIRQHPAPPEPPASSVRPPVARQASGVAAPMGADNDVILR